MYSETLEKFIDLIIADGEITEKERELIHKKAAEEGVDIDEIDIVVEGRLAQMLNERKKATPPPVVVPPINPQQNSKHGTLDKCPNCGSVVQAGSVKCEDCGYTFRNIEAVGSVQRFSEMIEKIENESTGDSLFSSLGSMYGLDRRTRRLQSAIQNFPIPNAKEDLLEFILYLEPKQKMSAGNSPTIKAAYSAKYKECKAKAKAYFKDDPMFREVLGLNKKGLFGKVFGKK